MKGVPAGPTKTTEAKLWVTKEEPSKTKAELPKVKVERLNTKGRFPDAERVLQPGVLNTVKIRREAICGKGAHAQVLASTD